MLRIARVRVGERYRSQVGLACLVPLPRAELDMRLHMLRNKKGAEVKLVGGMRLHLLRKQDAEEKSVGGMGGWDHSFTMHIVLGATTFERYKNLPMLDGP